MSRITMLTNADIRKVDLVPAGAQQLSRIEILKSEEGKPMNENIDKLTDKDIEEIQGILDSLKEKLGITDETETEKADCSKVENEECEKKEDVEEGKVSSEEPEKTEEPKDEKEECEIKEGIEKSEGSSEEDKEVKEALKKAADLEAENSKLKEEIAKAADEKEQKEFVAKAAVFKNIPGVNEAELGDTLRAIYKTAGKDIYEKVEALLKTANDTIGSGSLFVEKGSSSTASAEPADANEAWSMIEAMASNRVQKGISNTTNCIADVLSTPEGANLYMKYKNLRGGN